MLQTSNIFTFITCLIASAFVINSNVKFNVNIPSKISIKNRNLPCKISFTNMSKKPILVPNYLLGGMGIFYYYEIYDEFGNKIIPDAIYEYVLTSDAIKNKPTYLLPKKTRSNTDYLEIESFFPKQGRYRMIFYWDGFLDGNTECKPSRFSCEKWIEITE